MFVKIRLKKVLLKKILKKIKSKIVKEIVIGLLSTTTNKFI